MIKEYKETHQTGLITKENDFVFPMEGDFGIQIAKGGHVWICINGIAFLRFKPGLREVASQLLDWFHERQQETKSMTLTMEEFDEKYKQLFGERPLWYSWGPFYRDHGFVGLRTGARFRELTNEVKL